LEDVLDTSSTKAKIGAMRTLGVPYVENYEDQALADLMSQADRIAENLKGDGIEVASNKEVVALIAYLQRLGMDIKSNQAAKN
jgi:cytochrome c oxidase cbb3-type subunit I/II